MRNMNIKNHYSLVMIAGTTILLIGLLTLGYRKIAKEESRSIEMLDGDSITVRLENESKESNLIDSISSVFHLDKRKIVKYNILFGTSGHGERQYVLNMNTETSKSAIFEDGVSSESINIDIGAISATVNPWHFIPPIIVILDNYFGIKNDYAKILEIYHTEIYSNLLHKNIWIVFYDNQNDPNLRDVYLYYQD